MREGREGRLELVDLGPMEEKLFVFVDTGFTNADPEHNERAKRNATRE
jgi:hypothetical protein